MKNQSSPLADALQRPDKPRTSNARTQYLTSAGYCPICDKTTTFNVKVEQGHWAIMTTTNCQTCGRRIAHVRTPTGGIVRLMR